MPKFHVMSHRSAPRMLAALTGLIHYSQRTHGDEHNRDEDNDQGAFHNDLAPRAPHCPNFRHLEMNPE